ncbi:MAG: FtsW/RodA/SpoVE family cell cycle protein [Pyrinomonadaceae bacterium]|nr:FtsW/RodA/SpoVE family cell cycle protein [Pyrinomonadaceae bacterium]MDQ3133778.1 FtsW/RodA/SpoVE family cell cycle protein [Acidobacteriota bacterium]
MKNRASSHLIALLLIIAFQVVGYVAVYRSALLRGYEPSIVGAARDLLLYVPILGLVLWLSRRFKYAGNWTVYTAAILLFSVGMLVQYRLYSDPEYNSRNKAEARAQKTLVQRLRYMKQFYDAEKLTMLGLPTDPQQLDATLDTATRRQSSYTLGNALTSSYTWIPLVAFVAFGLAFWLCVRDDFLNFVQRHSFIIVLTTLIPLVAAVVTSSAGKALGNMTPWEPSKIPFLLGFAGILTAYYRDLAKTYWGMPRAQAVLPLMVMAAIPFIPFFALKDFGQMLVFSGAYATLYLVAVRRWPQLLLFVGSVVLVIGVLVVGALPVEVQEKVPLLPTLSRPVQAALPSRIKQRFHLWLDGFNPPRPEVEWWKKDYDEALSSNAAMKQLAEQSPAMQKTVNVDVWFDRIAFQPSQATFGIASGGMSGRGLGLGFAEVIPVADSDYIYAAIAEELGLAGGAVVMLALLVFVSAGVRAALDARDMFTKLCAAGLVAFIGFQALVNIGGITRALPMTGITLPFVSHGGFSLITSFAMLGMLMAFSHRNARDARAAAASVAAQPVRRVEPIGDYTLPEAVE